MTEEAKSLARFEGERQEVDRVQASALDLSEEGITRTAGLLKTQWGSSMEMAPEDWKAVAELCMHSGMNPVFDMDILGGKPYDKADFWKGLLADHPNVEYIAGPLRADFGSDDWDQFICISDPDVVAAAYVIEVKLRDRDTPVREGQYVKKDDPILWSAEPFEDGKSFPPNDKDGARAYAGPHGRTHWIDERKAKPWMPKGWLARKGVLAPDWEGLAAKKCRTTVFRRIGKVAVPRVHAKVLLTMNKIERMSERALKSGQNVPPSAPRDPYGEVGPGTSDAEIGDGGSDAIREQDRRSLMAQATRKGLAMDDVKRLYREACSIPEGQEVHISDMTYEELVRVIAVIDEMPEERAEIVQDEPREKPPEPKAQQQGQPHAPLWPEDMG